MKAWPGFDTLVKSDYNCSTGLKATPGFDTNDEGEQGVIAPLITCPLHNYLT